MSQEIIPTPGLSTCPRKSSSKNQELHPNLRVWLKIILGWIHHHPSSSSSDYVKTYQKCILYYLHKGLKLNLPSLLSKYLRGSVRDTRNNMKPRNYIPMGRLISDVLIESGLVDHLISLNQMEDVTMDVEKPLNGRNLKSMGLIDKVCVKPTRNTFWKALKDQRERANEMYLFSNIDPPEVITCYFQDLETQGFDISDFSLDLLLDQPHNFWKIKREPSQNTTIHKKKILKLGESLTTKKKPVLLTSSSASSSKLSISEAPHPSGSRQLVSSLPIPSHTLSTTVTISSTPPTTHTIALSFI